MLKHKIRLVMMTLTVFSLILYNEDKAVLSLDRLKLRLRRVCSLLLEAP